MDDRYEIRTYELGPLCIYDKANMCFIGKDSPQSSPYALQQYCNELNKLNAGYIHSLPATVETLVGQRDEAIKLGYLMYQAAKKSGLSDKINSDDYEPFSDFYVRYIEKSK